MHEVAASLLSRDTSRFVELSFFQLTTMSFGWSAGDIMFAATLVCRIGKALQESTGAAQKYRQNQQQLNSIELQLRTLTKIAQRYGKDNSSVDGGIRLFSLDEIDSKSLQSLVTEMQRLIGKLEEKILKGVSLGSGSSDKKQRRRLQEQFLRSFNKLRWEFLEEDDTKTLIAEIYQLSQSLSPLCQHINM